MTEAKVNIDELVVCSRNNIVAVEAGSDGSGNIFVRNTEDSVVCEQVKFYPWLLVSGLELANSIPEHDEIVTLHGEGFYNQQVFFNNESKYRAALKYLKKETGYNPTSSQSPYKVISDLTQQMLTSLQLRSFRGMKFSDIKRLQLDIETFTTEGYDFSNAGRIGDEIIMLALSDSTGWECCLSGTKMSEKEILTEMIRLINQRDPDIIEGHNIFNFDLPYIEKRCKLHKLKLTLGRDGSVVKSRTSRINIAERTMNYRRYTTFGRHFIDTFHLVQLYDAIHRDLPGYGLKEIAKYFGVAKIERVYVQGDKISETYLKNPELLEKYNLDDVRETAAISKILSPSYFYQSQIIPYSYQNCIVRGNAVRIEAMLIAEYICAKESIPTPNPPQRYAGGLTEAFKTGIFKNIWHCDIRSLYPSIIISKQLHPIGDSLKIFNSFLTELRKFRLIAKDKARATAGKNQEHWEALQSTFKILINSFYGYCAFSMGSFNDYHLADTVTTTGRKILTSMLNFLQETNAQVIEMDTDGIYFVPPTNITNTQLMQQQIQQILPQGIEVDLDSTYKAMFAYKSKNYALLGHDNKISVTGAALKSRGLEPFQRQYMRELITLLLHNKKNEAADLFAHYKQKLQNHEFSLSELAKRENLATAPKTYAEKIATGKGRRSAAYELVLKSNRTYKQGDQVAFYITGNKKSVIVSEAAKLLSDANDTRDENIPYYMNKLQKLKDKFANFLPDPLSLF